MPFGELFEVVVIVLYLAACALLAAFMCVVFIVEKIYRYFFPTEEPHDGPTSTRDGDT